jgi:hypothetical protein
VFPPAFLQLAGESCTGGGHVVLTLEIMVATMVGMMVVMVAEGTGDGLGSG